MADGEAVKEGRQVMDIADAIGFLGISIGVNVVLAVTLFVRSEKLRRLQYILLRGYVDDSSWALYMYTKDKFRGDIWDCYRRARYEAEMGHYKLELKPDPIEFRNDLPPEILQPGQWRDVPPILESETKEEA